MYVFRVLLPRVLPGPIFCSDFVWEFCHNELIPLASPARFELTAPGLGIINHSEGKSSPEFDRSARQAQTHPGTGLTGADRLGRHAFAGRFGPLDGYFRSVPRPPVRESEKAVSAGTVIAGRDLIAVRTAMDPDSILGYLGGRRDAVMIEALSSERAALAAREGDHFGLLITRS